MNWQHEWPWNADLDELDCDLISLMFDETFPPKDAEDD
jgi:hypothetical protein